MKNIKEIKNNMELITIKEFQKMLVEMTNPIKIIGTDGVLEIGSIVKEMGSHKKSYGIVSDTLKKVLNNDKQKISEVIKSNYFATEALIAIPQEELLNGIIALECHGAEVIDSWIKGDRAMVHIIDRCIEETLFCADLKHISEIIDIK